MTYHGHDDLCLSPARTMLQLCQVWSVPQDPCAEVRVIKLYSRRHHHNADMCDWWAYLIKQGILFANRCTFRECATAFVILFPVMLVLMLLIKIQFYAAESKKCGPVLGTWFSSFHLYGNLGVL